MSGDWIKVEVDLPEKPEVWQIAGITGLDADSVVGKLIKVWRWFDSHTESGNAVGVTYPLVDHVAGVTGFADAMAFCGWLEQCGACMSLPNFERHNGKTAKNRALTAKRVAKFKEESNVKGNAIIVTTALPKEEKSILNQKTSSSADEYSLIFLEFWAAYPRKVGKDEAFKAFKKRHVTPEILSVMLRSLSFQAAAWSDPQFIPHASKWLNSGRWKDESVSQSNGHSPDYMVGAL